MQSRPPIEERFPRPSVMGVVNVTPDSFSDGGVHLRPDDAIAGARRMVAEGAAIVDVGGESTRPGSEGVSLDEELRRVLPVLEATALGRPVLVGFSRKSTLGRVLGEPTATTGTTAASVGAAVAAFERGATILRVHDVREHVEALTIAQAVAAS